MDAEQTPNADNPAKQEADELLDLDFEAIKRKLKDGKSLTAGERRRLDAHSNASNASQNFVRTQVELAEVLGVSRKRIQRHLKREGSPGTRPDGRYDVIAWREYFKAIGPDPDSDEIDSTVEKARNQRLKNQKLAAEIEILTGNWRPKEEMEKLGAELGLAIRKVIQQIHICAPQIVGLSVAEAEARLKDIEDEVLQQLHLLDETLRKPIGGQIASPP